MAGSKPSSVGRSRIICLATVREAVLVPTRFAAFLAQDAGIEVCETRPGFIQGILPSGRGISMRVTRINPFEGEAQAYLLSGKLVPSHVLEDIERWEAENKQ